MNLTGKHRPKAVRNNDSAGKQSSFQDRFQGPFRLPRCLWTLTPRRRPGQGMTEYALVTVVLTTGFFVAGFEFFPAFIQAFQRYYDSFYVLINLPIP